MSVAVNFRFEFGCANSHRDFGLRGGIVITLHHIDHLRESFASVITQRRLLKGWAQEDLAAYSGLERSYISRLEKGLRTPSLDVVFRCAAAFKIAPQTLVKEINLRLDLIQAPPSFLRVPRRNGNGEAGGSFPAT